KLPTIPLSIREFRKIAPSIEVALQSVTSPAHNNGDVLLSMKDLNASYQDSERAYALSGINLEIREGEVVALMGRWAEMERARQRYLSAQSVKRLSLAVRSKLWGVILMALPTKS
ncbi:MAG: hypothetical protein RL155_682, partial [Actinomycetota bacterium]